MKFYLACALLLLTLTACTTTPDPEANLDAWATAAIQGDYVTARQLSRDSQFVFDVWKGNTERNRRDGELRGYRILASEQRGQTTMYWLAFEGNPPHCTIVDLDPQGRVSAHYPYTPNSDCGASEVQHATR